VSRKHEFSLTQAQDFAADESGIACPSEQGEGEHHVAEAWSKEGNQGNCEQQAGEGEEDVDQSHYGSINPASHGSGERPEEEANGPGDQHDAQPDTEGDPRTVKQASQDIAAKLVLPAGVLTARRAKVLFQMLREWIQRCDTRHECDQRNQGQGSDNQASHTFSTAVAAVRAAIQWEAPSG